MHVDLVVGEIGTTLATNAIFHVIFENPKDLLSASKRTATHKKAHNTPCPLLATTVPPLASKVLPKRLNVGRVSCLLAKNVSIEGGRGGELGD